MREFDEATITDAKHLAQAAKAEARTKVPLDQNRYEQHLAGVTYGKEVGSPEAPDAQKIGRDARDYRADRHRQSCAGPKRPGRRPPHLRPARTRRRHQVW
jgi:hypothetical protein